MHHRSATNATIGLAAVVAVAATTAFGSRVLAGLIPGSGTRLAKSDCLVELNVQGIDSPGTNVRAGRVVRCTDGDPCDTDGVCGNNSCTLRVAVCIDQQDPNLPTCHPPTHLEKLHVSSKLAVPSTLDGSACGSFVALTVPRGKKRSTLRLSANATAPKSTNPRRDRDTFVLKCLPRTTPCTTRATTTTTTTPTVAGGSTTTTTLATGNGCRFRHGTCTGSCAPGSTCGAAAGSASCACRSVSCGDADAPQCNGACASASNACIFDLLNDSCHCVKIP